MKSIPLVVLLLSVFFCSAQVQSADSSHFQKKILIVPYNPMMHLSDADGAIADYSEKNLQEIRTMFRTGISQYVNKQLLSSYESHDILADMRPEALKTLDMIYGSLNYSYDTVFPIAHPKLDSISIAHKIPLKQQVKKELTDRSKTGDVKYMNVKLSHPEILKMLAEKYDVDYFIFLNQFELKTNYGDCIDLAAGIYRRDLKVHYSIFRKDGEQVFGDVAEMSFASDSNYIGDIMTKNFPPISQQIAVAVQ
jgi:hypothetical protein